jgi:hypothetical protein
MTPPICTYVLNGLDAVPADVTAERENALTGETRIIKGR